MISLGAVFFWFSCLLFNRKPHLPELGLGYRSPIQQQLIEPHQHSPPVGIVSRLCPVCHCPASSFVCTPHHLATRCVYFCFPILQKRNDPHGNLFRRDHFLFTFVALLTWSAPAVYSVRPLAAMTACQLIAPVLRRVCFPHRLAGEHFCSCPPNSLVAVPSPS